MTNKTVQISPDDFRKLRRRAGFKSQLALARHITCDKSTVWRWENGLRKIPYSVVRLLMDKSTSSLSDMIDMGLLTAREAVD